MKDKQQMLGEGETGERNAKLLVFSIAERVVLMDKLTGKIYR